MTFCDSAFWLYFGGTFFFVGGLFVAQGLPAILELKPGGAYDAVMWSSLVVFILLVVCACLLAWRWRWFNSVSYMELTQQEGRVILPLQQGSAELQTNDIVQDLA